LIIAAIELSKKSHAVESSEVRTFKDVRRDSNATLLTYNETARVFNMSAEQFGMGDSLKDLENTKSCRDSNGIHGGAFDPFQHQKAQYGRVTESGLDAIVRNPLVKVR